MLTAVATYLQSSHTSHSVFEVIEHIVLIADYLTVVLTEWSLYWEGRRIFRAVNKKNHGKIGLEEVSRSTSMHSVRKGN